MTMGYSKNHPAIGMTWHTATTVCKWLAQKTGKKYRLPTEAEWEYAARAGSTKPFGVCDAADGLKGYAWYKDTADMEPHAVATKKSNAWGLYDSAATSASGPGLLQPSRHTDSTKENPIGPE
jgi:formylglycine-generating enzyme required for sulfatase activity